jgi:hypothetical protein
LLQSWLRPAGNAELGAGADVALEGLAVIADRLHDPDNPVLGQAELFAEIAVGTHGALELGLVGLGHLLDVLLVHAKLSAPTIAYKVHFTMSNH